ncbi:MAG: hypothetical protein ABI378_02430 [Chitinophagaceae bacterium]
MKPFLLLLSALILQFTFSGCKKSDSAEKTTKASPSVLYKDTLAGTWTWQHIRYQQGSFGPYSETILPDTTFPIVILNDSEIVVQGLKIRYSDSIFFEPTAGKMNDTAHSLFYCDKLATPWFYIDLYFYKNTDSVVFRNQSTYGVSGNKGDRYYTKIVH